MSIVDGTKPVNGAVSMAAPPGSSHPHPAGVDSSASLRKLSTSSLKNCWKLKYQDFIPGKPGSRWTDSEQFHRLVDRANEWLHKNEDVRVRTCETITWMSHEQRWLGDSDQMILSKTIAEGTTNYFLRGLRVWLVPASGSMVPGTSRSYSTIHCTDVVPETKELIDDLVEKINRKLKNRQIRGRLLSVETVAVPIGKNQQPLSGSTRWTESVDDDSRYAFVLRVFTDRETTTRPHGCDSFVLGLRDVIPAPTESGYESFEELIEKSNNWLKDQSDVIITNMQSLMVQRNEDSHAPMGSACFYTMPGITSPEPVEFFRILRIAHMRLIGDKLTDVPTTYPFTYETFTPELVRVPPKDLTVSQPRERLEKMKETFSKVIAFLRNSGVDVICSETVMNPMQMYIEETGTPSGGQNDEENIRFLFTIRLFLTGQIGQLLDGSCRMIKRASIQPNPFSSPPLAPPPPPPETSDLLPSSEKLDENNARAPLFLSNVVGRQFKYRWLILAVSAFTCMTIIVALSVVYSNR